jgi:uncharacterized tellurite resistance protein B-like protein
MRGMPFESQSSDQDAHLKAVIKEHFDIQDHQVDQLIQFMYHNVNRYEALRDAGV